MLMQHERNREADFAACPILREYVATMLQDLQFRENDDACSDEREPRDTGTIYTLPDDTFARCKADCEAFWAAAVPILDDCDAYPNSYGAANVGADFWLTRVGHGAGFWDRDALQDEAGTGDALTELAGRAGSIDPYFGDDGAVYLG